MKGNTYWTPLRGALLAFGFACAAPLAGAATATSKPQLIDDSQLHATTTTMGGAEVLATTRTVVHWWGSTTDPHNGITYGYSMVGANPNSCAGDACSVTIEVDITPLIVTLTA